MKDIVLLFLSSVYLCDTNTPTFCSHTITFPAELVIWPVLLCPAFTIQALHQTSSGFKATFFPRHTYTPHLYTNVSSPIPTAVSYLAGALDMEERTRQMKLKVEKYKQGAGSDSRLEQDHRSKASHSQIKKSTVCTVSLNQPVIWYHVDAQQEFQSMFAVTI